MYDQPTVLSVRCLTARTDHTCSVCKKAIKAGEQYRRMVMALDGEIGTVKIHRKDCLNLEADPTGRRPSRL